jgi:hypothetical protein
MSFQSIAQTLVPGRVNVIKELIGCNDGFGKDEAARGELRIKSTGASPAEQGCHAFLQQGSGSHGGPPWAHTRNPQHGPIREVNQFAVCDGLLYQAPRLGSHCHDDA